ncbi:MAG: insulinase family protein [Thermoanaerobaculia bacterium]|nr:insulinase family protein [Thermoanaerobaculia bacterium]
MSPFIQRWSMLLLLSIFSTLALAQTALRLPPGVQKITSVEGITEYSLPNGLRVLLFPDPSKPIITVNITYKVGSRHENYGETGMAHLLEHLVFKGTPRHPNIPQELTEHGARPNGTTWFDRTNYFETFDATEENLRWALDLESDRMINSFIARKDLESEFSVVRNEYERGENSPGAVLNKRMMAAVYQWHNYGHSTIGEKSDIELAPIERLQAFYRHYYQPDNAVLVVAGKIDEQKTLDLVNEYFGPIPKPARQLITTYTKEPTQDGERQVVLRRTGDVQLFSCMYRSPAGSHPDYAPLTVLANLLTDEPTGRLYKALVESKKAVSVFGGASGYAEGGTTGFTTEIRQDKSVDEAQAAMLSVLDGLKDNPPTQEEVDKAKTRILKNWELNFKQSDRIGLSLSNYIGTGDWRLAFLYRDLVEKVTPEDVARVALRYLKPANRTVGFFLPEKNPDRAEIPDPPSMEELLKDYKGKAAIAQGEDFDPSPANIEKRTIRGQLPNGMEYALLPKENRGDAVNATLTFRFGTLESLQGKATVAGFTASLLDRGTATKNRQQIKETLDRLKARVNFFGGASSVTVNIETDREHLAETIRLVGEIMKTPTFPQEEFDKDKQEYLTRLDEQKTDPNALAGNLFDRISNPEYPKTDPRYTMTFGEEIAAVEAVKLEEIKAFHKQFYGAGNATAAVVGDFDKAEIEKTLRETFGNWKSPSKYERIAEDYKPVPARNEQILTPDKSNAVYMAGFGFPMRNDDPEYPALTIGGQILGGGFLNSRLATRIRQKDGLSYTVRGGFSASAMDKDASFNGFMIYNPENLAKLEVAFREEIERAAKEGFTTEELEAAKSGWLKSRKVSRSGDNALAGTLNAYLFYDRDLNWDAQFEKNVENLSLEQVNNAMKRYLDYSKMIIVKAGDFKKAEKP